MSSIKKLDEEGKEYHLEEETGGGEGGSGASKRKLLIALGLAAAFLVASVVLAATMLGGGAAENKLYTVDSSRYGVPDECGEDVTAFCTEDLDSGSVNCSCGDYLYVWSENDAAWVLSSANGDDEGENRA